MQNVPGSPWPIPTYFPHLHQLDGPVSLEFSYTQNLYQIPVGESATYMYARVCAYVPHPLLRQIPSFPLFSLETISLNSVFSTKWSNLEDWDLGKSKCCRKDISQALVLGLRQMVPLWLLVIWLFDQCNPLVISASLTRLWQVADQGLRDHGSPSKSHLSFVITNSNYQEISLVIDYIRIFKISLQRANYQSLYST